MSERKLPAYPSLEQLQKQAKDLHREHRASDPAATLAATQFSLARDYGFASWARLKDHVAGLRPPGIEGFERLAADLAAAYSAGARAAAIREINWNFGASFPREAESQPADLAVTRRMVAHAYGFVSWDAFAASFAQPPADPRSAPIFISVTPPYYTIDWSDNRLSVRGPQSAKDWDAIFGIAKEHGIAKLRAGGIGDAAMRRLPAHITHLEIAGSKTLTDIGVKHLARLPRLAELDLGGWTSPITDAALEVLRHLPELHRFSSTWTQGISDAGIAHLVHCERIENVNLLGTRTGDGAIAALAGKPRLHMLKTGAAVTGAGLHLLHEIPTFKTWQGGEPGYGLMAFEASPSHLLIDGPFTDAGLASLTGLDGLFGLTFFGHCSAFTPAGLASLRHLANLGYLGCQGANCGDEAMRHIAAIPRLRMLMGQGTVATDAGFEALSRSRTIEYIWGRECPNLTGRGFAALAGIPALRGLAVSCKNVGDGALATLPSFPALRELIPMDVPDAGFRHIGACAELERLWCMHCRDTGDAATEFIGGLKRLRTYYAGKTQITDRSLEILGRMASLEEIELWQCAGVSDTGIGHLAGLLSLRELKLDGLPGVSRAVVDRFPPRARVRYSG